jgi:hypothetical protein
MSVTDPLELMQKVYDLIEGRAVDGGVELDGEQVLLLVKVCTNLLSDAIVNQPDPEGRLQETLNILQSQCAIKGELVRQAKDRGEEAPPHIVDLRGSFN